MPYLGKTPSQATRQRYYLTASGGETSISGTMTTGGTLTFNDGEFVDVKLNGVSLVAGTDYNTTTANTIGGLSALAANDQVEIIVYDTFSVFGGNVNADFTINNGTFTAGTVDINGGAIDGVTIGTNSAVTDMRVDNIKIDGNTLSSTDTNGDITLDPNGTGDVIIASGNLGIGEASPSRNLLIKDTDGQVDIGLVSSNTGVSALMFADTDDSNIGRIQYLHSTNDLTFTTNDSEAMRIDNDGKLIIGTTSSISDDRLQIQTPASGGGTGIQFKRNDNNTDQGLGRIRWGNTADDDIGIISVKTDGADNSGAMLFQTASSGTTAEQVRIDSSGALLVGKTSTSTVAEGAVWQAGGLQSVTRAGDKVLRIRRNTDDGTLVDFLQAGTQEGTISVSGSTVSYNGGHLSRWSQATDGNRIDGLVKGTVMTNLDQMAVWHHDAQSATYYEEGEELPEGVSVGDEKTAAVDAYDEDNEQLNCMAVSSVEGDANVAGVFVNWDDDDEDFTADMNIAMTGDMVIRIASGTTVARGDLLMSAGDGTAKPQGDDIVRSKTIAKVTSVTKSHTYDDGSYLVPCVLMAC